jgi:hypothetical protein
MRSGRGAMIVPRLSHVCSTCCTMCRQRKLPRMTNSFLAICSDTLVALVIPCKYSKLTKGTPRSSRHHRVIATLHLAQAVARKDAGVVNDIIRSAKVFELVRSGANKHVMHEQSMIGTRRNNSDLDLMVGMPPRITVKHKHLLNRIEIVNCALSIQEKSIFVQFDIDSSPPNIFSVARIIHNPLVFRGAPGLSARANRQRA